MRYVTEFNHRLNCATMASDVAICLLRACLAMQTIAFKQLTD
jgi:hypothetical protein